MFGDSKEEEEEFLGFDDKEVSGDSRTSQEVSRGGSACTIFHILPYLIMIFGLMITGVDAMVPKLDVLYDCKAAIMKGIFAAPSEKTCRDNFRTNEMIKYRTEVRKYQVIRTTFQD